MMTNAEIESIAKAKAAGQSVASIARSTGHATSTINNALARIDPYGRVMDTIYGPSNNSPAHRRKTPAVGGGEEIGMASWGSHFPKFNKDYHEYTT